MSLVDWLPLFPWEGPPLPRFLGIFWPWLQGGGEDFLHLLPSSSEQESSELSPTHSVIYENTEDLTVVRDESGRIERIIRKIAVTKNE